MKIGKATVPRTAICTSDAHTIVVRGRDLSKELIGKIGFVEHFFLLLTGQMPSAGEAGGAERHAGGDCRTWAGAQRAGRAHDLRRRARCAAGRGRRGHPRLRLGGAGLVGDRRAHVRRGRRTHGPGSGLNEAALAVMQDWRAAGQSIPGYGHPLHKERDARVNALFDVARASRHRSALRGDRRGRRARHCRRCWASALKLNVSRARSPPCCWARAFRCRR